MSFEVIIVAILMFFLLVGVHEWGHFYFAKRSGILTREFAIGFGPKILSFRRGETQYNFRLFPMGGYVRMAGEDPEQVNINQGQTVALHVREDLVTRIYLDRIEERSDVFVGTVKSIDLEKQLEIQLEDEQSTTLFRVDPQAMIVTRGVETQIAPWDRQFGSKTVGQRAMVIFAGPMMNFVLALLLFFAFAMTNGVPLENATHLKVGSVAKSSPAEAAGLMKGDLIDEVNGETIALESQKLISLISEAADEPMQWTIIRDGQPMMLQVTPRNEGDVGRVGIAIQQQTRTPTFVEGLEGTWTTTVQSTTLIFDALRMLVTFQLSMDDLGGPVRIAEMTGEAYSLGISTLLFWIGMLSLYLGIFNLLPFPALDGSRLVFFAIEAVRGRPIDPQKEGMVHFIGFALLMMLIIAVTYNDILRLFKG